MQPKKVRSCRMLPPAEWEQWVEANILPENFETVCCYCGRSGDDLVDYIQKASIKDKATFTFTLEEVLKKNRRTLIPVEPPWIKKNMGETLLVIGVVVACFGCIEEHRPALDVRSIGDAFVSKL
jgi:hypothetical protein